MAVILRLIIWFLKVLSRSKLVESISEILKQINDDFGYIIEVNLVEIKR